MRIPGFEPEQVAWEATIITTRSYPQVNEGKRMRVFEGFGKSTLVKLVF